MLISVVILLVSLISLFRLNTLTLNKGFTFLTSYSSYGATFLFVGVMWRLLTKFQALYWPYLSPQFNFIGTAKTLKGPMALNLPEHNMSRC